MSINCTTLVKCGHAYSAMVSSKLKKSHFHYQTILQINCGISKKFGYSSDWITMNIGRLMIIYIYMGGGGRRRSKHDNEIISVRQ